MQGKPRGGAERPSAAPDNPKDEADGVSRSTRPEDEFVIPLGEKNPGTWDQNKPVVKYAWEAVRNAR